MWLCLAFKLGITLIIDLSMTMTGTSKMFQDEYNRTSEALQSSHIFAIAQKIDGI